MSGNNKKPEEADMRMILHAYHVAKSNNAYETVVLTADCTDVLVLALGLAKSVPLLIYQ